MAITPQSELYHRRKVFSVSLVMPATVTFQEMADYILLQIQAGAKKMHPTDPMFYFDASTVKINTRYTQKHPKLQADLQKRARALKAPRNPGGRNQWTK